jgi:hypothetical protein
MYERIKQCSVYGGPRSRGRGKASWNDFSPVCPVGTRSSILSPRFPGRSVAGTGAPGRSLENSGLARLLSAICATMTPIYDEEAEEILKRLQAGFTGDVQYVLDPRHPLSKMSSLPILLFKGEFMDSTQSHPDIARARELVRQRKAFAPDNPD